jgi:hypothetical protein
MTCKELVEALKAFDPDKLVFAEVCFEKDTHVSEDTYDLAAIEVLEGETEGQARIVLESFFG